ncbi:asparagine synthase (glutamine-hydrolyzing) [Paludibaculum fermentans]|uniref:asparagine synthase (glutamine-hydrolyzing) n=1 Tax=Paludibaculum fermentans TaxID=1473598 RepID=A0A7S7NR83_PALFE|nr:asparagine synthase (glutamine-hydrolyzing) [Paludibaculum fermentans]QOY88302.1 asparagine synthase (glutamine-hydrolyzing) [Paludibaculum fermentans]
MCGIAGFTKLDHPVERGRIDRIVQTIHHRGPDHQGTHESDLIALGNARLSIIDLSSQGNQPIYAQNGDLVIVYNGEVYNHADVRRELEELGHSFETHCDTEVVLKAFVQWDTQSFKKLRGMFAIAIWSESKRRLVLARDRMGIKPLYMFHRGRDLYFGSELKTILEHPEIPRKLDLNGLSYYLSLNYVPAPYTLIEGLEKLLPGEFLEWQNGYIQRAPYWSIQFKPDSTITLEDGKQELDRLLRLSIREHLISDVPLGVWASGGLDSSAVLHYAAQEVPKLNTFSVSFKGQGHDESEYFRQVAAQYGTNHNEFDLNPEKELVDAIGKISYYSDEPSADAGALPVWFLSEMTRKHVTVALSGEGADELFGGYLTYVADGYAAQAQKYPRWMRRLGLGVARMLPVSDEKIGFEYKAKRFLEGSLLKPAEAHLFWNGSFNEETKRALYQARRYPNPGELINTLPTEAFSSGELNRFLWLDQRYYLSDDILYKCDRMSMAHSLEVRPPFLDHRIVDFAGQLPESLKIQGSSLKHVLRELMRDKLPPAVLTRKKEGFDIPAHRWFRGVLRPLMEETLSKANVDETGLFRSEVIEKVKRDHVGRRANLGYQLWGLLTLFLWMKRWKVETAT